MAVTNNVPILFRNARVFDGTHEECAQGMEVLVEGGLIREVSDKPIAVKNTHGVDVGGRTLMPGLIDAHIHAYASDVNFQKVDAAAEAYRGAHAARMLGFALDSGFTTVRDIGGGDYGLWRAIEDGLIRAPRFLYAGKIISMTGGHGDLRQMSDSQHSHGYCSCGEANSIAVMADGVDACIKAVREELRRGAHCIKIVGSGGVSSPTDPIWMNQFREDEIRAIVNETRERRTYTSAHCHPASAIRRCVEFGVRVIEHGTLIDEVFPAIEILRQATSNNAALLQQEGKLGCVSPGAHADLLVVEGDPLQDIELLAANGRNLRVIMRAGELVRNQLG
jgi:imidazolonepropionase-like amidohydrolase